MLVADHPMFTARTKVNGPLRFRAPPSHPNPHIMPQANIYPDGRKPQHFMTFMSPRNRCVAWLLRHFRSTGEVRRA